MNRASPVDMRKALVAANEFKKAGILFVPIPVLNAEDHVELLRKMNDRLETIATAIESGTEPK